MQLLKVENIQHLNKKQEVIWEQSQIGNVFHLNGQLFLLSVAFNTESAISVPSNYYVGLDNRATPVLGDTLATLSAEPTQNGYLRQAVNSLNGFSLNLVDGNYRVQSAILTFTATGGAWGPVRNLFLTTSSTNSGYLLATSQMDAARTILDGQSLTMRISVGLNNC